MKKVIFAIVLLCAMSISLFAQDFYDPSTVNEIRLYFTQSNWDQLLDQLYAVGEDRLLGTAIINGVTYDSVGVRYKGNSSYSANQVKNPFNIKLDYIIKDQLVGSYGSIKLSNGYSDPSFVRETLSYEIARKYMPASLANYAVVYVNDVKIGVYTSVQDVDSYFMNQFYHCSGKPRFKCDTNSMSTITVWGYLGADSTAYASYYGIESDYGWADLINFTNVLSNNQANIADVMNVDQNLWMTAFDNLLVNMDSPINIFHNFYLFGDSDNRLNPIIWDLNMAFGTFPGFGNGSVTTMQQLDPLRNSTSNSYYLLSHVLSNARYKKQYIAHMRTMIQENFSNSWYSTRASELQAICGPHVQTDTNFGYTYANFQSNINSAITSGSGGPGGPGMQSIPGITQLMNTRATYLLNHTSFSGTVPVISNISYSPQTLVAYSTANFTLTATNATYAQLGVRQNHALKFNYYQMFDDGAHNDGTANDGVYGVSVQLGFGDIEYFGWAESSTQGAFLPARAEYEFFQAEVTTEPGILVINEIQAKNNSFADPNDELDDWVEIYNPGDTPVDLGGMYMIDSHYSNGISAWTQIPTTNPTVTTVPAHGYLLVWFDEDLDQGPLHIGEKLGGGADAVYLIGSDGVTVIDSYTWVEETGLNTDGVSIGRSPNGSTSWALFGEGQASPCTPGASNSGTTNDSPIISAIAYSPHATTATSIITISANVVDPDGTIGTVNLQYGTDIENLSVANMSASGSTYSAQIGPFALGSVINYRIQATDNSQETTLSPFYTIIIGYSAPTLYINELMPSNLTIVMDENGEYDDWAEIYNPNNSPIDLAGYYLTDNHYPEIGSSLTQIPSGSADTIIPAHGFKIIWFDDQASQGVLHVDAKLGTAADAVYLIAPDMLTVIDQVAWTADTALTGDISYGRFSDGSANWVLFGTDNPITPGASNSGVSNDDELSPAIEASLNVYPNPARGSLTINITGSKATAKVQIYNIKGQLVKEMNAMTTSKNLWDGKDQSGKKASSGVYFIKATVDGKQLTQKICVIN